MRLISKVVPIVAMVLAGSAIAAVNASAQVEIFDEDGEHCDPVTIQAHVALSGCRIEFQSTGGVPLFAFIPPFGTVQLSNCEVHFEGRMAEDGSGYVTQASLTSELPPWFPCTRTPCDESHPSHAELLWPFHLEEVGGQETIEVAFCLRPSTNEEGVGNLPCIVHLELADLGGHNYEIGHYGIRSHCENTPFDIWIENAHFLNEEDPWTSIDDIEIVH